jgi:hypothetical protein
MRVETLLVDHLFNDIVDQTLGCKEEREDSQLEEVPVW